jgi:protoporphyrinogen oxidase
MKSVPNSQSWGIVGGGILGMTLALRLAKHGQCVTLFEGASQLGGLASTWQLGDIVWDRHYHVTLLSDTYLRKLLAELGLEQDIQWVQTRTGFYTDGKLYSMSNSLEFLRFPPLNLWNKCRLGATILHALRIKHWQALEEIPVEEWLRRWSGDRTTEKVWLPLLRAKLGENYRKASAAFLCAIIARMYAARRSGMKKEMFGYVPGGYARILEAFGRKLQQTGVSIRYNQRATRIETSAEGGVNISLENGESCPFDQAILTMPAPVAARLCPQLNDEEKQKLQGVEYQGIVCASLLLKKPLVGYYVTNITDDWVPFTAVIEMSALVDRQHFGGNALIYLPKYLPSDDPWFKKADDEIRQVFLAALVRMYPSVTPSDVLSFQVSRVKHVFAVPTLNYSSKLPPLFTSVAGVQIVNSAHIVNGTLNVNETVQLAERTLPDLLATANHEERRVYAKV